MIEGDEWTGTVCGYVARGYTDKESEKGVVRITMIRVFSQSVRDNY